MSDLGDRLKAAPPYGVVECTEEEIEAHRAKIVRVHNDRLLAEWAAGARQYIWDAARLEDYVVRSPHPARRRWHPWRRLRRSLSDLLLRWGARLSPDE